VSVLLGAVGLIHRPVAGCCEQGNELCIQRMATSVLGNCADVGLFKNDR